MYKIIRMVKLQVATLTCILAAEGWIHIVL